MNCSTCGAQSSNPIKCDYCGAFVSNVDNNSNIDNKGIQYHQTVVRKGIRYLVNSDTPFQGKIYGYYDNGALDRVATYKSGVPDGPYELYHSNGQLEVKSSFKGAEENENIHGTFEKYFSNGQLFIKAHYKNGIKDGSYEQYYENGQLNFKTVYENDELSGPYESYYESGQLEFKTAYKNNKHNGPYEDYYENGQLWKKGTQKNGTWEGPYEQYFANGQISEKGTLKNGQWVGTHEEFYENGDKINFINEFTREYKESTGEEQRDMLLGCGFIFFIMYLVFIWIF